MLAWLEERTALPGLWRRFAEHPVPGGPRLRYVLPAVLVYLFVQQGVLGVLLGKNFLDYSVLSHDPAHGREYGIFLVEAGVLITVSGTMTALFYAFSERGR